MSAAPLQSFCVKAGTAPRQYCRCIYVPCRHRQAAHRQGSTYIWANGASSVSSKAQVYNKIDMLSISHLGSMTHGYSAVEEDSDSLTLNFQYLQLSQFVQPISLYGCAAVLTLKRAQCNADCLSHQIFVVTCLHTCTSEIQNSIGFGDGYCTGGRC